MVSANNFRTFSNDSATGKWQVFFFWPKDFTFVCPTEIAAFGKLQGEFGDRDALLYGVSTDNEFVHLAWRATYIVDPQGIVQFVYITDLAVGRSPEEVLRVLDALQLAARRSNLESGMSSTWCRLLHLREDADYSATPI